MSLWEKYKKCEWKKSTMTKCWAGVDLQKSLQLSRIFLHFQLVSLIQRGSCLEWAAEVNMRWLAVAEDFCKAFSYNSQQSTFAPVWKYCEGLLKSKHILNSVERKTKNFRQGILNCPLNCVSFFSTVWKHHNQMGIKLEVHYLIFVIFNCGNTVCLMNQGNPIMSICKKSIITVLFFFSIQGRVENGKY